MSALDKKLGRDLWRLKGQVATIGLVLACGIMAIVMLRSTWSSLLAARDAYYDRYRFGDVFAHVERAPLGEVARLAKLPGVAVVDPRIVKDVMVPMPHEPDPVTGRIVSLPDEGPPLLDELYLRAGRMPRAGAPDEAVVLEQFATAHDLQPGDHIPVVIGGRLRQLQVVGIALSPEYVLAMSGREIAPDKRGFVVLWMLRDAIAPAFRMAGAFDDVVFRVEPGASQDAVLDEIDRELAPYGGLHAVPRDKQLSNYALTGELSVLQSLALIVPAVFLAVAVFLVNIVVSRLVFLERTQIAVLKALGFTNARIGRHYLVLVALVVGLAAVLGVALGVWSGRWMTHMYDDFYRFPTSLFHVSTGVVALSVAIGLVAGVAGTLGAVRRIARMPPAQAMRPPAPLAYRRSLLERLGLGRVVGPSAMMIVREIERRPLRFALSSLGIALGVGIFIMGRFGWESFDHLMTTVFPREHQEDMTISFVRSQPARVLAELEHLPGVELAEGQRVVAVRLHAGDRWRDTVIIGMPHPPQLRHLLDHGTTPIEPPPAGLLVTDRLAERLGVRVGDAIDADLLEGSFATRRLVIGGVIDEAFGLQAYARASWLAGVMDEEPRVSLALVRVDSAHAEELRARLKQLPAVLGVTTTGRTIERFREENGESLVGMTLILTLSAAAIAIGVVYNNARIAVSMRSRDLASLRVLGFTRREISSILLGELAAEVFAGIPLGFLVGHGWSRWLAGTIDAETIRFPLYIPATTYATAGLIALVAGGISALLVRRQLDRLDLVEVLKSTE